MKYARIVILLTALSTLIISLGLLSKTEVEGSISRGDQTQKVAVSQTSGSIMPKVTKGNESDSGAGTAAAQEAVAELLRLPVGSEYLDQFNELCNRLVKTYPFELLHNLSGIQMSMPLDRYSFLIGVLGAELAWIDCNSSNDSSLQLLMGSKLDASSLSLILQGYGQEFGSRGNAMPFSWDQVQASPVLVNCVLGFLKYSKSGADPALLTGLAKVVNLNNLSPNDHGIIASSIMKFGDPESSMELMIEQQFPLDLQKTTFKSWLNTDADTCLNFLKTHADNPSYDEWVLAITPRLARLDLSAARAWIETIKDEKLKQTATNFAASVERQNGR